MFIYQQVDFNDFLEAFERMGRASQYSYDGFKALFHFLESVSEDTKTLIELDPLGLCCEFAEYTIEEYKKEFEVENIDELYDASGAYIIIELDGGVLIGQ